MRPVSYILLAMIILVIALEVLITVSRKKVRFMRVRSEFLPEGFLKAVCPQLSETGLPAQSPETSETLPCAEDRFREIAENADPDTPNQAVLYIEDRNIILVSAGIVARIAGGDRRLMRRVARWTESAEGAFVVVANFGVFKYSNS
jgi:hypothetical protein